MMQTTAGKPQQENPSAGAWLYLGAIVAMGLGVLLLSRWFDYDRAVADKPIESAVLLLVAAGLAFVLLARVILAGRSPARLLTAGIAAGFLLRLAMLASLPIMETDFYRYLWDGGVSVAGFNPYVPVPAEAAFARDSAYHALAQESGSVVERINHPYLRTIYPPVAQVFFALSHAIAPWSLTGWRCLLLLSDVLTLALLLQVLARSHLRPEYALLYWLNPIVLKEISNAAHMDVLIAPFLLGAVVLATRQRLNLAILCLAGATGLKLWPVLLVPVVLRAAWNGWPRALGAAALFAVLVAGMHVPVFMAGLDSTSGFTAYAERWEMNNSVSLLLIAFARWVETWGIAGLGARPVFSALAGAIVATVVLLASIRPVTDPKDLAGRFLAIAATLFLVSPTQFPWYALWFLPLLAIRPHLGLLFYSITLPLYYLRFRYDEIGLAAVFDNGLVWLEHGPVLVLLVAAKWRPGWIPANPGTLIPLRPGRINPLAAKAR